MKREPIRVNITRAHVETPVVIHVEVDMVEEDNDLGRGNKPALKSDADG